METFLSKIKILFVTLLGCSLLWAYDAGAVGSLKICIKATNTCVTGNNTNTLNIGTLQNAVVRIDSISGQTAQVFADDAGSIDKLAFKGAKVTFLQPATDYEIEITGTGFLSGPNLAANPGPNYRLTASNQTFKRGASGANLDVVKAKGFVIKGGDTNQVGGDPDALDPALVKFIYVNSFNFFNGSFLDESVELPPNGNRDLRINLWFTAKNTGGVQDIASFPSNGLELKNTTAPGGGEDPSDCDGCGQQPPSCTKSSMLSTSCATTYSTMKTFGCPTCIYDDRVTQQTAKARMFVENNLDNLEQDLARGGGEHLTALTVLLDVPETQRGVFCEEASDRYRMQAHQGPVTPEQLVATIQLARESRPISPEKTRDGKRE